MWHIQDRIGLVSYQGKFAIGQLSDVYLWHCSTEFFGFSKRTRTKMSADMF